jgi:tetratricopeptide (TPR) repeat protein
MMDIQQCHQLAQQAINQRDYVKAHGLCVQIINQRHDHADAYFLLGVIHVELGQINKAVLLIEKALSFDLQIEYFAHLAKCYALSGNMSAALDAVRSAPLQDIEQPLTLDTLGVALSRIGQHELALDYFDKALSLEKNNPLFFYNYAVSSKFAGLFSQARVAFERAIELKPDYYQAHFALSDLGEIDQDNNHIERLALLLDEKHSTDAGLHLGHALAKEYEALGEHGQAFAVLTKVKKRKLANIDYAFSNDKALFDCVQQTQFPLLDTSSGFGSDKPIFIVGMPRSGTTLVERIISNHSDVVSCGELQDFGVAVKELCATPSQKVLDIETLQASQLLDFNALGKRYIERTQTVAGDAKHFVDKLPFNFFYIGLIRRALPNAKIVCLLRNPMDTCVGNFRQLFSINSPYYSYAFDKMNTARFYQQFYCLAVQWQQSQTENFYLLNYEQLVAQPEQQIKQLIRFCGLDWQEQCLHAERNTAPVSTASKVQVREPINSRSIGRWLKFKPYTDEMEAFFIEQGVPIR